jgi:hypothetical protein
MAVFESLLILEQIGDVGHRKSKKEKYYHYLRMTRKHLIQYTSSWTMGLLPAASTPESGLGLRPQLVVFSKKPLGICWMSLTFAGR